ncbi:heterokaryon incompatibility protein-domain-containing protein [Podospora fimiseda]|uniref:Heterokaryon incompatibility protein-domain-containing protein n=1 Tax=Podospora fimiseda TaxID=252190 RepID=A0AAN7BED7_9PEZI|nr:heterokaryon incompatibility protein-domain-containing protein [Podospora fimiseda]
MKRLRNYFWGGPASASLAPTQPSIQAQGDPDANLKVFRRKLKELLVASGLEASHKFLPASVVSSLVTQDTVRSVLPHDTLPETVDFICRDATKLFLTLIVGGEIDASELQRVIIACQKHGMTDGFLPIEQMVCLGRPAQCQSKHLPALNVFHDEIWADISFRFYPDQGMFHSPVFTNTQFRYELKGGSVLPITWKSPHENDGHFSTVYEAIIHSDHHGEQALADKELRVALKKLKPLSSEPGYNVEKAWNHEASALQKISDLRHKNLIRPLAAIRCGPEFYIMFEWANGGSLRTLWQHQGHVPKDLTADRVMCFLEEIFGLSGALSTLHNTNTNTKTAKIVRRAVNLADVGTSASAKSSQRDLVEIRPDTTPATLSEHVPKIRFQLPSDDESHASEGDISYVSEGSDASGEEHWRHGDLKPDNILQFLGPGERTSRWMGSLKIADLGLAKQHMFATTRRNEKTNMQYTTSHYEAPEANRYMSTSHLPRSRRFDIWSMGCVLFEFVIVVLYGSKGLEAFYSEKQYVDDGTETLYFSVDASLGVARVSDVVTQWIRQILKDPECNRPRSAIADVVKLIRDRLLVVELPTEGMSMKDLERCRADAGELKDRLEDIWETALDDEESHGDYLFVTRNRSDIPIPTPARGKRPTLASTPSPLLGQDLQRKQRSLTLDTTWNFPVDNVFARAIFKSSFMSESEYFPGPSENNKLCPHCAQLDVLATRVWVETYGNIRTKMTDCDVHKLIFQALPTSIQHHDTAVEIFRSGSNLFLKDKVSPLLSICRPTVADTPFEAEKFDEIQIGLPKLPKTGSSDHFHLVSQWLQDCDTNHDSTCRRTGSSITTVATLPTRLIEVGNDTNEQIYLRVSKVLRESGQHSDLRYIALSHPWGDGARHNHFCTTWENFISRLHDGISVSDLPNTFRDAILVTRALGIKYIWIDSLCIIQGVDGDFNREAKFMETVFSSAYCVVAASQARGTSSGFLSNAPRRRDFIALGTRPDRTETVYLCQPIDDFQSHIIDGHLNKRGWVLQERALAQRTIYFAEAQTYFECGRGVRCETLTRMTNNQAAFLGDPNFPQLALTSTKGAQIRVYESLYKTYSRLEFSKPSDRPIAIAGLEQRLVAAFNTHGGYGVFDGDFFGRSLLWKRDSDDGMKKIDFSAGQMIEMPARKSYRVPSWSWMAYEGPITFMDIPFRGVEWHYRGENGIRSPWTPSTGSKNTSSTGGSWHTGNSEEKTNLTAWVTDFSVSFDKAKSRICFDQGPTPSYTRKQESKLRCVVVGRQKASAAEQAGQDTIDLELYVLAVMASPKEGRYDRYERVGVAAIPGSWIIQEEQEEIQIF